MARLDANGDVSWQIRLWEMIVRGYFGRGGDRWLPRNSGSCHARSRCQLDRQRRSKTVARLKIKDEMCTKKLALSSERFKFNQFVYFWLKSLYFKLNCLS